MLGTENIDALLDAQVQDSTGDKIGKVGQLYLDDATGNPQWVTVSTGLFGTKESFVPVTDASYADGVITVPVSKDQVKDAPQLDADGHLDPAQEEQLYQHYRLNGHSGDVAAYTDTVDRETGYADTADRGAGHDTSGPDTDEAMTRSEEQLQVGTEKVETGRARLRKYIVTSTETVQVPVSREEVRIEREPITDANRDSALSGGDLTEEEHEVTLTEERAVVSKETVPVERVRMGTDTVSDTETVTEEVRSERIDVDTDGTGTRTVTDADTDESQR